MKRKFKSKILPMALGSLAVASFLVPSQASAQGGGNQFLGQLMQVGYTFCPRDWTEANGQLLAISSNSALFSLYGTTYGGDGRTTFALPDLRGRAPIHTGQGPGLANYALGSKAGRESFSLTNANQLPSHNHNVQATDAPADLKGPGLKFLAKVPSTDESIYHNGPPNKLMDPLMITNTGSSAPVSKRSPYLTMRWCVALTGIFPSRN